MPFRQSSPVEERIALFRDYESGAFDVPELYRRHGISWQTFQVWEGRQAAGGERWFEERGRALGTCPNAVPLEVIGVVVAMREGFASFGPKKIRARARL